MANRFPIKIIDFTVLGLGYYEAIVGILRWIGIMHSHHYGYSFTGTFYNPGPYACFLSLTTPIAVSMMDEHNNRATRWVGTGMVLMCAILIPPTLSRTAMVACGIGTTVALWKSIRFHLKNMRKSHIVFGAVLSMIVFVCLYSVKKDSADGRLLIWKMAAQAATDVPMFGVGWDNVAGVYGNVQEHHFMLNNTTENEKYVADAPEYVFNEYLQVAIAFGPVVSLLVIIILSIGLTIAIRNHNYGMAGSTVAVAIVMFASYPLQFSVFIIAIGIVLSCCFLSAKSVWTAALGVSITICCSVLFMTNNKRTDVSTVFHNAHSLHIRGRHMQSNAILLNLQKHSADPMILNIIGKNYQTLGMIDSAIFYLEKSTFRCPNRMYPHYLLMKLFSDSVTYNKNLCLREAQIILSMKPKVQSKATDDMKREATAIIKSHNNVALCSERN